LRDNNGKEILRKEIKETMEEFNLSKKEAIFFIRETRDQFLLSEIFFNPIIDWNFFLDEDWKDDLSKIPDFNFDN